MKIYVKYLALVLALLLVCMFGLISCGPTNNNNDETLNNNKTTNNESTTQPEFESGSGTAEDPYIVSEAYQWLNISNYLNAYFELTCDLNLGDFETVEPVGTVLEPFKGMIDGNGHKIVGANISGKTNAGLFGVLSGATIRNLNIENSVIEYEYVWKEESCYGIFAGRIKTGSTVENCHCKNIKVQYDNGFGDDIYVGGFAGGVFSMSNIKYCSAEYTFSSKSSASGAYKYGGVFGIVENSSVDTVWASGTCALKPSTNSFYFGNWISSGLFYKVTNSDINNVWCDVDFVDNVSSKYTAAIAYSVDNESGLSNCVCFCNFSVEPKAKYINCDVVIENSDSINIYYSEEVGISITSMNKDILESGLFDSTWIAGTIHPVFTTYEKFLEIRASEAGV